MWKFLLILQVSAVFCGRLSDLWSLNNLSDATRIVGGSALDIEGIKFKVKRAKLNGIQFQRFPTK